MRSGKIRSGQVRLGQVRSSVSNPEYRLPGYPVFEAFFCFSNTRVIGSSSRVIRLSTQVFKLKLIFRGFFFTLLFLIFILT